MTELRIVVVAPVGRDSQLIGEVLSRAGMLVEPFPDCASACAAAANGIGAFLIAEEVLTQGCIATLVQVITAQPSWSDLPVIILTATDRSNAELKRRQRFVEPLGNTILIERPVRPETLVSAVKSAMRARTRQYQARDAADALRRSEKLAVTGRLAASIAHEINNPLEAIINLHFLMRATDSREKLSEYLAMAEHELQRVAEITRQTLRFYRENGKLRSVDMAAVIESVLKLYDHRVMAKHVSIRRRLKPNVSVKGFSGELRQVLANLVSNALDAMPAGGTLYVRVTPCGTAPHGGSGVRVTIADTGKGIPGEIRAKILEPFVSTKQETGTGLGLWISCEIIRKHGGTLRFRSREGRGTAFSIFLPCEPPHGEAAEGAQAPTLSEVSVPPVA